MSELVIGVKPIDLSITLVQRSTQAFALKFTPPEGETLDLSDTTFVLEIDKVGVDLSYEAVTEDDTATWTFGLSNYDFPFKKAAAKIVAIVGGQRLVIASGTATVI